MSDWPFSDADGDLQALARVLYIYSGYEHQEGERARYWSTDTSMAESNREFWRVQARRFLRILKDEGGE